MREFGWSIEYTLSLSFPVFLELSVMIRRLRCDAAVDEFYLPYAAVKVGGKPAKRLFEGRGSFLLEDKTAPKATEEETQRALERLRRIIKARKAHAAETVAQSEEKV